MERKSNPLWKNSMTYGAILGGTLVAYGTIVYLFKMSEKPSLAFMDYLFTITAIVLGTKTLRDKFYNGFITYSRALGSGILICMFAGLIYSVYAYLLYAIIDPSLMDKLMVAQEEFLLQRGQNADQVEMQVEMMKKYMTPVTMAISGTFGFGVMGLIFSLITSLFLKREPSPFDQTPLNEE